MPDLSYRPITPDDLPAFSALVSDWEVVRQLGSWPWPPDPAFTASRCKPYAGAGFVWGIIVNGILVGTMAVTGEKLGYSLRRDLWGQGIISRAARTAVDHAFATTELTRIQADIWADNIGSARVLTGLGFTLQLTETVHALARNEPTLSQTWDLTRADWQGLRTAP